MEFALSAIIDFAPRLIIAGVLTYFFISAFDKMKPLEYERPKVFLSAASENAFGSKHRNHTPTPSYSYGRLLGSQLEDRASVVTYGSSFGKGSPQEVTFLHRTSNEADDHGFLRDSQMIMLAVDMWMLLTLLLSPLSSLDSLLPSISTGLVTVIYVSMGIALFIGVMATTVSRMRITTRSLVVIFAAEIVASIVIYMLPSMQWTSGLGLFMHVLVIYITAIFACALTYLLAFFITRRTAFYLASTMSLSVYIILLILFVTNFFSSAF